jgi:hypothetical protein
MKRIIAIVLMLAANFGSSTSFAQQPVVQASIPFSFSVNGQALPAGRYMIRSNIAGEYVLSLQNRDKHSTVMTLGHPNQATEPRASVLVFHRYGDQYFLSEIRTPNSAMNYFFTPTKAEKWAKAHTEVAKGLEAAPILLALK